MMPYIGCILTDGKTIERRFQEHLCGQGCAPYLYNAIKKHRKEHFQIEQIDAGNTPEQALELERWWIARLMTQRPGGYNITAGGKGASGFKWSEESKRNSSAQRKGKHITPEHYAALSQGRKRYVHTPEHRAALGKSASTRLKGKPSPRKGIKTGKPAWNRGVPNSSDARAKMSASHKLNLAEIEKCRKNSPLGTHIRWHVKRNVINPVCPFCQKLHYLPLK